MKMNGKKPYLTVILIQSIYGGMFLLSKAAFDVGMNNFVFVFYRQATATVFLVPLALFLEWKKAPPLSFVTFSKIFVLSLCGVTLSLNIYGIAVIYTSASLAAATANCLPAITFFLAVLLGMEVVRLRTTAGIAKVAGIAICTVGVVVIAFYKGPSLKLFLHHHLFGHHNSSHVHQAPASSSRKWIKGCFLMLIANTLFGLWIVLQYSNLCVFPARGLLISVVVLLPRAAYYALFIRRTLETLARVMKRYSSKLLFTTLQCLLSSIQSFFIAIALERDLHQWKLGWNIRLLAVLYCGIVVTGVTYYLQTWVIEKKGPVFLAMSTPLALVFTIIISAFFLGEIISLGSVLGGILLVGGLYSVLWGKSNEQKITDGNCLTGEAGIECSQPIEAVEKKSLPAVV